MEKEEVDKLRIAVLDGIFAAKSQRAVEAAVEFTRFTVLDKVNPDNYPIFLELMKNGNHSVIEAMVGDMDPNLLFNEVESNEYIIRTIFEIMKAYQPGELNPKLFGIALGVLLSTYIEPKVGLKKYRVTVEDLNAVAKNLDKSKGQHDQINRQILDFLGELGDIVLETMENNEGFFEVVNQAVDLRNAFFDPFKDLSDKIPELLVAQRDFRENLISPRKARPRKSGSE